MLDGGLHDAITSADVMHQEVPVRMKRLIAERGGNSEVATVNGSAGSSCSERCNMTRSAANFVEERFAILGFGRLRKRDVARGSFRSAHESGEVIDIGKSVGVGFIVGFGSGIAKIRDLVGLKPI